LPEARFDGKVTERKMKMAVICTGNYASVGIEVFTLAKNYIARL